MATENTGLCCNHQNQRETERQEQRLETMLRCLLSNRGMAKQPLKFMEPKDPTDTEGDQHPVMSPRILQEVSQEGIKRLNPSWLCPGETHILL